MAGTISSLGIGSGVLTADMIDKLKNNDTKLIITPIDNKLTLQKQKNDALNLLNSLLTTFKSNVSALDNDGLYQQRSVSGSNSAVSVTADAGVAVQSISISNTVLALKDVKESGSFSAETDPVATGSGTMTLAVNGTNYNIGYTSSTKLTDLKDSINTIAGKDVQASILQVGTNDFRLILTSAQTGANQAITVSDSGGTLNNTLTSYKKIESQSFTAPTDPVAPLLGVGITGNLDLKIGTVTKNITYDNTTTLQGLSDAINLAVGASVSTVDLNTNRLVIQSNVAGFASDLTLTDNSAGLDSKLSAYTTFNPIEDIQVARDASLTFNGIAITRSTNEISDIITGVKINLLENSGSANISISQNAQAISDEMKNYVESYNALTAQLKNMTVADLENNKVGIFNGDTSINSISREINRIVTSISTQGLSLPQFGIDLNQEGVMSFNASTFISKFNANPKDAESFLSGSTSVDSFGTTTTQDGVFTTLKSLTNRYTGLNGLLTRLTESGTEEIKSLNSNRSRSLELLNKRYETMATRFALYDAMISKLNNQFSSLQQQISMAANGS